MVSISFVIRVTQEKVMEETPYHYGINESVSVHFSLKSPILKYLPYSFSKTSCNE